MEYGGDQQEQGEYKDQKAQLFLSVCVLGTHNNSDLFETLLHGPSKNTLAQKRSVSCYVCKMKILN